MSYEADAWYVTSAFEAEETLPPPEEDHATAPGPDSGPAVEFGPIAAHLVEAIALQASNGVITYANPACEAIWGPGKDDAPDGGPAWLTVLHPADRPQVEASLAERSKSGTIEFDYRVCPTDGGLRWIHHRVFPLPGAPHAPPRVAHVARDITTERSLGAALHQARAPDHVAALATGMARDFGNLLMGVVACAERAVGAKAPAERRGAYVVELLAAARRGLRLTRQLASLGREQHAAPRLISVDATVLASAGPLDQLVGHDVQVQLDLQARGAAIVADPVQIERILLNLAANAHAAMPAGGTLTIRDDTVALDAVEAAAHGTLQPGRHVRLTVSDTGVGMGDDARARAFEPFFTTRSASAGSGLGLAIVWSIAQDLGGHVAIESSSGRGTTVVVLLPRARTDIAHPARVVT